MPENSAPANTPVSRPRVSVGEIAAFVAESNRIANGGPLGVHEVSGWDRAAYFEWKADLFTRLSGGIPDESATAARAEAARLHAEATANPTANPAADPVGDLAGEGA